MGLLNMVRGEGSKIIQLFGRRLRLKVKGLSLKRILPQDRSEGVHLDMLEAMSIFAEISSSMNVSCFSVRPNIQHGVQPANAKSPSSLQAAGLVQIQSSRRWALAGCKRDAVNARNFSCTCSVVMGRK